MMPLQAYLAEQFEQNGFTTEDALAAFLPLLAQVLSDHQAGKVAPLEGLQALNVERGSIWYERINHLAPRLQPDRVRAIDEARHLAIDVVNRHQLDIDVGGQQQSRQVNVRLANEVITTPVYLPGYVSWEHQLDHHDPLTDIFSLGMILASLCCSLDFNDESDLRRFAASRNNLFALQPGIHPVVAKTILGMTELSRHVRLSDLETIQTMLTNYRQQTVDFDLEISQIPGFEAKTLGDRQQIILSKLQERLFEISRRNRLYHFKPSMQSLNLTQASVPLSFNVENIRPDEIMTWTPRLQAQIVREKPIALSSYLNFHEVLYLPGSLDKIRTEAAKDQKEYGFAQLRLVLCFLNWSNLKDQDQSQLRSPLVLLPVELQKKKGVRDTWWLKPLSSEAEINPVIRYQFKTLFGVNLPERIDLQETTLDALYDHLQQQIAASEPGVTLDKIERPRIDLIQASAKRRLDQYRKRTRLTGRSISRYANLDYSYDPANFNPLGIRLFNEYVRAPVTDLKRMVSVLPIAQQYAVAPSAETVAQNEVTAQRQFYRLRDDDEQNPYQWAFDLCNMTLANFKYRKMSLVKDYAELVENPLANDAFEATFSLQARELAATPPAPLPLQARYHVVPCDPTQTMAIAHARAGKSYIIQGPPGTGKSQTITNLIADYIMRDQRVLFVCEKRAAIDVVFLRLKQKGLDPLCCLIHDSQADKKSFVMDLKKTYEDFLAAGHGAGADQGPGEAARRRQDTLTAMEEVLAPLQAFSEQTTTVLEQAGGSLLHLMQMLIAAPASHPSLDPEQLEQLPHYTVWVQNRSTIDGFIQRLAPLQPSQVFSEHPLRLLNPILADHDSPLGLLRTTVPDVLQNLRMLLSGLTSLGLPAGSWDTLDHIEAMLVIARQLEPLSRWGLLGLLDEHSQQFSEYQKLQRQKKKRMLELVDKHEQNKHWNSRLSAEDTGIALAQATRLDSVFRFFFPSYWKLRSLLKHSYDFAAHAIAPSWIHVLQQLTQEHEARKALQSIESEAQESLGFDVSLQAFEGHVVEAQRIMATLDGPVQALRPTLQDPKQAASLISQLLSLELPLSNLRQGLGHILVDYQDLNVEDLQAELLQMEGALQHNVSEFLFALKPLRELPEQLTRNFRHQPWSIEQLELMSAERSLSQALNSNRSLREHDGSKRRHYIDRLRTLYQQWQHHNSAAILETVRNKFLEHVRISAAPAAQLTQAQKDFKKVYAKGRRELEHEFSKSMRYKPIRDMVAFESGAVIRDLKPVWLMSPLSVSDTLPLNSRTFDVIIFDEASQITLEGAIPSLFRAPQTIVVGDQMQLPPTNFFSTRTDTEDEVMVTTDEGEQVEYDLSSNSFLNHVAKNLKSYMLGWHYRSRSEHLISFSNWAFYQGQLLTVPDEKTVPRVQAPMTISSAADAGHHIQHLLSRPVSFHHMPENVYDQRRNTGEAEYIAQLVRHLLAQDKPRSMGIIAFSEAQQDEIESALDRLAAEDSEFALRYEQEQEREEDGEFVGLLVKNLENIQGDERDIIIMSICYGYGKDRKMRMNFGPINQSGGEKRLNVAFSRAKHHMVVVSSIQSVDITNDYNEGANSLKNYLRYSQALSAGDIASANQVLMDIGLTAQRSRPAAPPPSAVSSQLKSELEARGWQVDMAVGQSHFKCDLGVKRPGDDRYALGILIDSEQFYAQSDLLEREFHKPELLKNFGWQIEFVLTKDWLMNRDRVLATLTDALGAPPHKT
ncbi:AAA domain-containing protein [Allohahella sp. A8]|uniref:AAA domain-containing protein n=1 Tax=Allohahella sp. A8 TaxID=3141461 RepID=UPI003A81366E